MFVLRSERYRLALDVLDYQEKESYFRTERNQLYISLEVQETDRASMITAQLLSTHELTTLGNWFGQAAIGINVLSLEFIEPGLTFKAITATSADRFRISVSMTAWAAPRWTHKQIQNTPFELTFDLTYHQMLEAARQLQELHRRFPSQ